MDPRPDSLLTEISEEECRKLLADHCVGRLGMVVDGEPVILPVNYAFDGEAVVFRTDPGLKLTATPQQKVAFEIDDVEERSGTGWSVLVRGFAREITRAIDHRSEALRRLPITPFAPGEKGHWIEVVPKAITGRRLGPEHAGGA